MCRRLLVKLAAHSPAYSWDAELKQSSRARQEETVNAGRAIGMGGTLDRRLRWEETLGWGRYRLGLLSVT